MAWAVRGGMGKGTRLLGTAGDGGAGGASPSRAVTRSRRVAIPLDPSVPAVRTGGGAVICPSDPHCRPCDWPFFFFTPRPWVWSPRVVGVWRGWAVVCGGWLQFFPSFVFFFFFSLFVLLFLLFRRVFLCSPRWPLVDSGVPLRGGVVGCTLCSFLLPVDSRRGGVVERGRGGGSPPLPLFVDHPRTAVRCAVGRRDHTMPCGSARRARVRHARTLTR